MQFLGYGLSDRGLHRPANEDVVVLDSALGLWIVCDGMGGHAFGDLAARTAAETFRSFIAIHLNTLVGNGDPMARREAAVALMRRATVEASRGVFKLVTSGQGAPGMGTTLTALMTLDKLGIMAHVGDSRLYLARGGALHQLSDDHTIAAELVRRGGVPRDTVENISVGKALSRAVGVQPSVEVDSLVFDVLPDDTFLLCSDGLTRYLSGRDELQRLFAKANGLEHMPRQLVELAKQRGGRDNVSVLVVHAQAGAAWTDADHAHHTEVLLKLKTLRHVSLFQPLTLKELVQVMNRLSSRTHEAGETIILEGDPGDGLYVILEGTVAVTRGGNEIALLGAGTHFGEMALLNDRPRSATVSARTRVRLMKMNRPCFHELIAQHAELTVKLLWTFAQVLSVRLEDASEHLLNVAPTQRIPDEIAHDLGGGPSGPPQGYPRNWRW